MKQNRLLSALSRFFKGEKPKEDTPIEKGSAPEIKEPERSVITENPEPELVEPECSAVDASVSEENKILPQQKPVVTGPQYKIKTYRVTGMQHYMDALMELAVENEDYLRSKRDLIDEGEIGCRVWKHDFYPGKVELVPEPDNPVDPKAIKVIASGNHIGYIKAGSCAHLLKVIRENRILDMDCEICGGKYKRIVEDYDEEKDREIYTLERDEAYYSVVLTIKEI